MREVGRLGRGRRARRLWVNIAHGYRVIARDQDQEQRAVRGFKRREGSAGTKRSQVKMRSAFRLTGCKGCPSCRCRMPRLHGSWIFALAVTFGLSLYLNLRFGRKRSCGTNPSNRPHDDLVLRRDSVSSTSPHTCASIAAADFTSQCLLSPQRASQGCKL